MLTSQETKTNSAYRGPEAFIWPQKIWEAKLHEAEEFVDKTFHFWHHVLVRQQEFIRDWLAISTRAEHKIAHMAHEVVKEATPERGSYDYDGVREATPERGSYDGVREATPERGSYDYDGVKDVAAKKG